VAQGLEGVVAKRTASRYEPGRRSSSWVKVKNVRRQEAVVGGWQPGERGRSGQIGSLLVGVYSGPGDRPELAYAGHVGTGFTRPVLDLLAARLAPLRRATSPFATEVPPEHARFAVWAEPALVIEVAFTEWTAAGRLRAPSYKGLRDDKEPLEVIRET
jgi:bifunctional non-homologous end joining protein LigD